MPRQKTEAAAYLDIYKLVTERKRLEQELEGLEQRRDLILKRLAALDQQTQLLEASAHDLRQGASPVEPSTVATPSSSTENYHLVYLEY